MQEKIDKAYLVNEKDKIIGEIRNYDLKLKKGELMYYNLDMYGYIRGYIPDDCVVMEEKSLLTNKKFTKQLLDAQFESFKKGHLMELIDYYEHYPYSGVAQFDEFAKLMWRKHGGSAYDRI